MFLKEFRKKNELSQKEMARRIKVSVSYYSKIESGYQNPSYDFMMKLKTRFPDVNIDEVFFDKTKCQQSR